MSGASALASADLASPSYDVGLPSPTVWDDLDGIDAIRRLLRSHRGSRAMDNYVLDAAEASPTRIRTALVLGPLIYGEGEGPGNRRSVQVPALARLVLEGGRGAVRVGRGENRWGTVHVGDVARVFTALAQAGADGKGEGMWGEGGIYLAGSGEMVSEVMSLCFTSIIFLLTVLPRASRKSRRG